MYSFLFNKDIDEKTVLPCYLLYGEESFLAREFVDVLKESLSVSAEEDFPVERMDLAEQTWSDVIDLARTIPFFFAAWRLIEVNISKTQASRLSEIEQSIIKAYLGSPTSQTVLILVVSERMRRNFSLLDCISSFPSSVVCTKELRALKGRSLSSWVDRKFNLAGKTATPEAKNRLVELTGSDLAPLSLEIEKISTFVDEKKVIELDDVHQVSGWVKSFFEWELTSSLEERDYSKSVIVLKKLFMKENSKPEQILGILVRFFRDILKAKLWLKEKKDKNMIFRALRPHISPQFQSLYREKIQVFFSLTEKISMAGLNHILSQLKEIDLNIKTSDLSPQVLIEGFLFDYCGRKEKGSTRKEQR